MILMYIVTLPQYHQSTKISPVPLSYLTIVFLPYLILFLRISLFQLSGALENAKVEIQRMQHEKEHFEDSMKKAFMRGVCALNLEAMTMFQNRNEG